MEAMVSKSLVCQSARKAKHHKYTCSSADGFCLTLVCALQACLLLDVLFPVVWAVSEERKDYHYYRFQGNKDLLFL